MSNYPEVQYRDLVGDGNVLDQTFERYVREWMQKQMPWFPMGLLDTNDSDRWELVPDQLMELVSFTVADPALQFFEEDEPEKQEVFAIRFEHNGELLCEGGNGFHWEPRGPDASIELEGQEGVFVWRDESEAQEALEDANQSAWSELMHEIRYGFPWANSTAYQPDEHIRTELLQAAGFCVASYVGGQGNWRTDESFRLAGIDGGGYSFLSHHWARLVALHSAEYKVPVETDKGLVIVTFDYRSSLEILADAETDIAETDIAETDA
jgi:hypothetical protein